MALHIRDHETDVLVRKLAKARGVGLTDAVRQAVENELAREKLTLSARLQPLFDRMDALPNSGPIDKAFYDALNDEDDR